MALFGGFADGCSLPWVYPPAFLLLVTPLSLLPFSVAYLLFIGAGAFLFVTGTLSVSRLDKSVGGQRPAALFVAASPCVFVTAIVGQNSLLTAALAALAMRWLVQSPVRAGICIGLLAIKPQMAIVFPFVLIAARLSVLRRKMVTTFPGLERAPDHNPRLLSRFRGRICTRIEPYWHTAAFSPIMA